MAGGILHWRDGASEPSAEAPSSSLLPAPSGLPPPCLSLLVAAAQFKAFEIQQKPSGKKIPLSTTVEVKHRTLVLTASLEAGNIIHNSFYVHSSSPGLDTTQVAVSSSTEYLTVHHPFHANLTAARFSLPSCVVLRHCYLALLLLTAANVPARNAELVK